jgi:hypothetical protein
VKQQELLSYWVVKAYDPSIDMFCDVFKSYGENVANKTLIEYLSRGICAVVEYRVLPMI